MNTMPTPLTGTLIQAGDVTDNNGQTFPGLLIACERETLSGATIPLYNIVRITRFEEGTPITTAPTPPADEHFVSLTILRQHQKHAHDMGAKAFRECDIGYWKGAFHMLTRIIDETLGVKKF